MLRVSLKFAVLVFAFGFASVLTAKSQINVCNLQLKVFSYNAISSKTSLENVEVILTNLKTKEKRLLTISPTASVFENLAESNYRIELSKKGHKNRKKETKLECGFADKSDVFKVNVYLWKDKSFSGDESNSQENTVETKNSTKTIVNDKTESVSQSETSDNKSAQVKSKATGKVTVRVIIDADGNVVTAKAVDGDSLLAERAVKAARQSKFAPTMIADNPIQVTGDIIYNFVP